MTGAALAAPAALTAATILLWASARIPEFLTALLFFALAMLFHAAPAAIVFSGFSSSAFWLVLSGFVLGGAIRKVGLADRAARLLAVHLSGSWTRLVGGVVLLSYALAFVMPSNMGRIALLMPIVLALAERAGLEPGSRGRAGLALAVGLGTFELSGSILPSNVPNLVLTGAAEAAYGLTFSYLRYLLVHAPILGLLKGLVLTFAITRLFPARPRFAAAPEPPGRATRAERSLGWLLLATLALWITDSVHGISPAWIGLAAACVCLLPRIGFLDGEEFAAVVNVRTCIYVAGILSLAAFVTASGLGRALGDALFSALPKDPAQPALGFATLVVLSTLLDFVVTANGVPALYTPLARSLADGTGLALGTVLMVQVIGYTTPLLPYQASPIVVAMGMGKVTARDGLRLCLVVAAATFLLLAPLDYAWFRLLGML